MQLRIVFLIVTRCLRATNEFVRRLRKIWSNVGEHVGHVDLLAHREVTSLNDICQLHRREERGYRVSLTLQANDATDRPSRSKDDLSFLEFVDVR